MAITFTTGETFPAGASVVTATKLNNIVNAMTMTMATSKVLGRTTASTGAVEELSVTGTGNVVFSTSPTLVTPALGTPSAIVLTNASGTASININGTVGATTPNTGAFTTLRATGTLVVGPSGSGSVSGVIVVDGSDANNYGAYTSYRRNTVEKMAIGTADAVLGSGDDEGAILSTTALNIGINGSGTIARITNTGLAVTGTLSATSTITVTSAIGANGTAIQIPASGRIYFDGGSDTYLTENTANNLRFVAGGNPVIDISSTGLAVTGTLSASGVVTLADTTDASSSTTGALKTAGGLGVAKNLYVGDTVNSVGYISTDATGAVFSAPGSGTSAKYTFLQNTGGNVKVGIEGSSGGDISSGTAAYSMVLHAASGTNIIALCVSDTVIATLSASYVNTYRPLLTVASTSGSAGLSIPHGTAPTTPTNGDIWTTTAGLYVRINGVTRLVTVT
jgi:hypothetical protein